MSAASCGLGCLPPLKQVGECDTILTVTLHIIFFILLLMSFFVLHISSRQTSCLVLKQVY
jgi:hypothetical protein